MKNINYKKLILILGIIIVLNLFFNYGIYTFYKNPKYEDFCKQEIFSKQYSNKEECEKIGGLWADNQAYYKPVPDGRSVPVPASEIAEPKGWCNSYYICEKEYRSVLEVYNRNVFIILIIAGVISIVVGFMVGQSEAVSLGLSFGGLISLIIGTIRYWSNMDDYLRFVILGISLAILIWLGLKRFRNNKINGKTSD